MRRLDQAVNNGLSKLFHATWASVCALPVKGGSERKAWVVVQGGTTQEQHLSLLVNLPDTRSYHNTRAIVTEKDRWQVS